MPKVHAPAAIHSTNLSNPQIMKVAVAGSVGGDHIMSFGGKFTDSLVAGSLAKVSLSFLVDTLQIRRGGCGANIAFGMGALGLNPILIAAVGARLG